MIILGESTRASTEVFVLFEQPATPAKVRKLGLAGKGRQSRFWHDEVEAATFRAALDAARATGGIACIASSDGAQRTLSGEARTELLGPVLDVLVAHFEGMTDATEDFSPWLLTRIIACTIRTKTSAAELSQLARAIDAGIGRGDDTSTEQNLNAFGNLVFYARKTDRAAVDRALAGFPALVGIHLLSDRRSWPRDRPLAPVLAAALAKTTPRHRRAITQLARVALDHHEVTDEIRAIMTELIG